MPKHMAAPPTATRGDSGYAMATMPMGKGQRIDEVTVRPSKNGGFIVTEQYRRTSAGKRAMSTPDWLPPEPPATFETFDAMAAHLRKCFGMKAKG